MELKVDAHCKCDNCSKTANFSLLQKKKWKQVKINLCKECMRTLYACLGSYITPVSPNPPYKKVKKEIEVSEIQDEN